MLKIVHSLFIYELWRCFLSKKKKGFCAPVQLPQFYRYGSCEACGDAGLLEVHHPLKQVVFGKNDEVCYLCERCHFAVNRSVKVLETEILKKFGSCYQRTWSFYLRTGYLSDDVVREFARSQFLKIEGEDFHVLKKSEVKTVSSTVAIGSRLPGQQKQRNENVWIHSRRNNRRIHNSLTDEQHKFLKRRHCPICGNNVGLTVHHILKMYVFGENHLLGFPCRDCHDKIEKSVTVLEAEILGFFESCYRRIWEVYRDYDPISDNSVRKLAKRRFLVVKAELSAANEKPKISVGNRSSAINKATTIEIVKNLSGITSNA